MKTIDSIFLNGILTGSRAFGTATEKSDWDIVIPMKQAAGIIKALRKEYEWDEEIPSEYFNGIKFKKGSFILNIISVRTGEDMVAWYETTLFMRGNTAWYRHRKEDKYALFEVLLNSIRLAGVEGTERLAITRAQVEFINEYLEFFKAFNEATMPDLSEFEV